jgi:Tol biopolymer transport system component
VYLVNVEGGGLDELPLGMQAVMNPQFSPGDGSIIFLGADASSFGMFEVPLVGTRPRLVSDRVEDEGAFAWSADGSQLAYVEMDRDAGEARLIVTGSATKDGTVLATLPIPKGSGSSLPHIANLNWSPDGSMIVFEFGRNAVDRAIYLAFTDGRGLTKAVASAHAPAISADGNCLAYISDGQVFLMDLAIVSASSMPTTAVRLAELPAGRTVAEFQLDKLQWKP